MTIQDYYPLIMVVAVIVGAIFALRIFFTFWGPVERKINGDKLRLSTVFQVNELKDKPVNIYTNSKTVIANVTVRGLFRAHPQQAYDLRRMLVAESVDGRKMYIKMECIEYMEEVSGSPA